MTTLTLSLDAQAALERCATARDFITLAKQELSGFSGVAYALLRNKILAVARASDHLSQRDIAEIDARL